MLFMWRQVQQTDSNDATMAMKLSIWLQWSSIMKEEKKTNILVFYTFLQKGGGPQEIPATLPPLDGQRGARRSNFLIVIFLVNF